MKKRLCYIIKYQGLINRVRGQYGFSYKFFFIVCDKNRRQFFTVVVTLKKRPKNTFAAKTFSRIYLGHLFVQDIKTHSGSDFGRHYTT